MQLVVRLERWSADGSTPAQRLTQPLTQFPTHLAVCEAVAAAVVSLLADDRAASLAGAALLTLGSSLLILGLLEGGVLWTWRSLPGVGVPLVGLALVVAFALVERRAAEPILPTWVFRERLLVTTSLASLAIGAVLIGLTSYVPLYAQNVLGHNALVAGFALAALTLGWPISASFAGRVYLRVGFRATALVGTLVTLVGVAGLTLLRPTTSIWQVGVTCFVIGLGMGFVAAPTLVAAQSSVEWNVRGVVTGTSMFARSMGSALGIAVFGAIANGVLAGRSDPASVSGASTAVFIGVVVAGALTLLAAAFMPSFRAEHATAPEARVDPVAPEAA
jgi:Na+/melibiose symporter-like transporter